MAYINYRENNPIYSPGLATYTTKPEQGDDGDAGFSIYYDDGIIQDNINEMNRVKQNILGGSSISSTESSSDVIVYRTGDLVLDGNANVYNIMLDENSVELYWVGCIRQTIGKIYQKNADNSVSIIEGIGSGDNIKINYLDEDFNIVSSSDQYYFIRLINTTTGEVAIFEERPINTNQ